MVMNQELLASMFAYTKGFVGIDEFRLWIGNTIWEILASRSPLDRMMMDEVQIGLSELDRGDMAEDDLKNRCRALLRLQNPEFIPERIRELIAA